MVEVASKIGKWREKYGQPTGVDAEFAFHPVFYSITTPIIQPNLTLNSERGTRRYIV